MNRQGISHCLQSGGRVDDVNGMTGLNVFRMIVKLTKIVLYSCLCSVGMDLTCQLTEMFC